MGRLISVDMSKKAGLVIGETGLAAIAQEIRVLLATRKGSLPLDRDFGVSWEFIDKPLTEAMPYMISEIASQLEKYVPRIRVKDISFTSDNPIDGQLCPIVVCEIREAYYAS